MKIKVQNDLKECGLVVIQSFYKYYFKTWLDINFLKAISKFNQKGLSIYDLNLLAKQINLKTTSYEIKYSDFQNLKITKPIIVLLKENNYIHFVIVEKKSNHNYLILDPIEGKYFLDEKSFEKMYLNIVIEVEKLKDLVIVEKVKSNFKLEIKNFYTSWNILLSIFMLIFSFCFTFLLKIIFEEIFPSKDENLLWQIIILFFWISFLNIVLNLIKKLIISKTINKLSKLNLGIYFQKYNTLNLNYSNKITNIDHLKRIEILDSYINFKTNLNYFLIVEFINLIASSIFLIYINWEIFIISFCVGFLILNTNFLFNKILKNNYVKIQKSNINFSTSIIDKIYSKQELKNSTQNQFLDNKINEFKIELVKSNFKFLLKSNFKEFLLKTISSLSSILIIYLMSLRVINNSISLGELLLFLSVFNFFLNPFYSFSDLISEIPLQKENKKILDFILNGQFEKNYSQKPIEKINSISLKNFSFSYTSEQEIFKNINFYFEKNLQLKGPNGSGKSTLMKIIALSNLEDFSKILVNDLSVDNYDIDSVRTNILYLYNDFYFFKSTLIDFVTLKNLDYLNTFNSNIIQFNLMEFLDRLNLNLNTPIESNGINLSSGQKQLILLLRLFVKKFDVILLDEVFENLQSSIFYEISKIIKDYQNQAIFLEISHNENFLYKGNELYI
ncbi:Mbov_0121 family peptidase domain-containing ABC transporter [[Mycoplasma] mobile]|nr:cysteine peptidase family C39 domain-containing protein [[Mycoplasma] mobile]